MQDIATSKEEGARTGASRYTAAKPCKHGHAPVRYVNGGGCCECNLRKWEKIKRDPEKMAASRQRWNASAKAKDVKRQWRLRRPKYTWACKATDAARARALRDGRPFNLDKEYVDSITPDVCPVFGTPFVFYGQAISPTSPSLDCFKPELGYVKGNVEVISLKANAIKSNATVEEVETVAAWMRRTIAAKA